MEQNTSPFTPKKRPNEHVYARSYKRNLMDSSGKSNQSPVVPHYKLKILLPNGISLPLSISEATEFITVKDLVARVKKIYEKKAFAPSRKVNWDAELSFIDDSDCEFRTRLKLTELELNKVYNLRLHDGSPPAELYENMWDLTPDTGLLKELPEEYTYETALADIIDNSIQAVWSNGAKDRRLIRVEVGDDKISIFDTGPGMDSMSIEKWGKMGASLYRASKAQAIGGKPPYLTPAFGMFGYGGFIASMHLGGHTEVSSKTKDCKKVYMLRLERDALVNRSSSKYTWRTYGGLRDPMEDEIKSSLGGSFTKIDIFEPKLRSVDIKQLQCKLKDIYFPYIQCDELSKLGRTTMPIEFQVNGNDLAEIQGGEVAMTNLCSCNGPEFVLQLRFYIDHGNVTSSPGSICLGGKPSEEANARLKCVYLPANQGKESIETILENLKADGYKITEDYETYSHVSCRRLGRLLPDARWAWLPFMDFTHRKGEKAHILKRSCMRVKCSIETDAGFNPTPSKTDFAHQNPYTVALRNLGNKQPLDKERGVHIEIRKDGKSLPLSLSQLDKQYQQWLLQMHEHYDEEVDCGIDEPVFVVNPINTKERRISRTVVRVHKAVRRKGKLWKSGQRIKILKGAYAGFHKTNVYATLEYILLEGFQGDAGGESWIICRPLSTSEDNGCLLETTDGNPILDPRESVSLPINVIDSEKCVAIDDVEWHNQLEKQHDKHPSSIQILTARECRLLGIQVSLPEEPEVHAGHIPPSEIVAVVRPASFKSGSASKHLDQKYVMKDNFEMSLEISLSTNEKVNNESNIYSGRVSPSSRKDIHGLYVFQPNCKSQPLFQRAGVYTFSFSIRDSSLGKCVEKVQVKALPNIKRWELVEQSSQHDLRVGSFSPPFSVAFFDKYDNHIPLTKVPEVVVKISFDKGASAKIRKSKTVISSDRLSLVIKNLLIESSDLDNIRPNYEATLMICLPHDPQSSCIPIKVFPGSIKRIVVLPEDFSKQLIPGHLINELILEMFDAYGNHLRENEAFQLCVDGLCFVDKTGSTRKVDERGYINLSGLLKVANGYGKNVSLSVLSDGKVIFRKEWQIEKRQLRIASVIPEICVGGSRLENVEFEVVNSKGDVDVSFHDEDKIGQSHTLTLRSSSQDIDESVKYIFCYGRCTVRAVPIPSEAGDFCFVAAHSLHPELQLPVKVHVELPPDMEHYDIRSLPTDEYILPLGESDLPRDSQNVQNHYPDDKRLICLDSSSTNNVDPMMELFIGFQQDIENELLDYATRIGQHEENVKLLELQQRAIESNLSELQVTMDQILCVGTYGSPGKEEIREKVESKTTSAAAVVTKLLRAVSNVDYSSLKGRIIGVVALLGTAQTFELSRILAEYLGDQMLAVVCKSYEDIRFFEKYKNGKLDRSRVLHMFAAEFGQSINGRYLVLSLEDIRSCEVGSDSHGKLLLPAPKLPNGATPVGYLGYAVNMINIDADHLDTRTSSGCGLRETLFYRLFGETQVYETREDMKRATSCIKDGAISLDGGILRGNGALSLGCWEPPDIMFPVKSGESGVLSGHQKQVLKLYTEKKLKLRETMEELHKERNCLEKAMKKYMKIRNKYHKYCIPKIHQHQLTN